MTLSESFIKAVVAKIDSPDVVGVGISGSYARGEESKYSDVDFDIYASKMPANEYDRSTLRYQDEKLISLKYALFDDELAALTDPRRAIWVVPGLSRMKVVLDKNGSLAGLQTLAQKFDFSLLQPAADEFAAEEIMGNAEEVRKILSGLELSHESTVLYGTWGLVKNLLEVVAVQKGIMIVSENRYFELIQEAVGVETKWVSAFRTAWGLDSTSSQYQVRGGAALMLYRLTAAMFDELIPAKHREVVKNTLRLIRDAGYT